jgi:hypothetical protein
MWRGVATRRSLLLVSGWLCDLAETAKSTQTLALDIKQVRTSTDQRTVMLCAR